MLCAPLSALPSPRSPLRASLFTLRALRSVRHRIGLRHRHDARRLTGAGRRKQHGPIATNHVLALETWAARESRALQAWWAFAWRGSVAHGGGATEMAAPARFKPVAAAPRAPQQARSQSQGCPSIAVHVRLDFLCRPVSVRLSLARRASRSFPILRRRANNLRKKIAAIAEPHEGDAESVADAQPARKT